MDPFYRFGVLIPFILVDPGSAMSFTEKVTVLELLLECIGEHEARLGDLVQAAENLAYVRAQAEKRHPSSW